MNAAAAVVVAVVIAKLHQIAAAVELVVAPYTPAAVVVAVYPASLVVYDGTVEGRYHHGTDPNPSAPNLKGEFFEIKNDLKRNC